MKNILYILAAFLFVSCSSSNGKFDAQGVFESEEVMVAAEVPGKLLSFNINEGDSVTQLQVVAHIDSTNLILQKAQLTASKHALNQKLVMWYRRWIY